MKQSMLLLLLFSIFNLPNNLYSQTLSGKQFYKHMEGNINYNIKITADLSSINSKIQGYYYYYFHENKDNNYFIYYGQTIPLQGIINENGDIELTEFNGKGSIFKGNFISKNKIEGNWKKSERDKKLSFELIEKYPDGTMQFEVYYLKSECRLVEEKNSPVASLELALFDPNNYPDKNISDSIKNIITKNFFGKNFLQIHPDSMLIKKEKQYFKLYKKSNQDIYDGGNSFNWEKIKQMNIRYNQDFILSLEYQDYGYTGGAHGIEVNKFNVIDLKNGNIITIDDIFEDGYKPKLTKILNQKLRELYLFKPEDNLKDAGFFVDEVEPNNNFYINKDGIGFYYNSYEIAPYSNGHTDIFISFEDVEDILKNVGAVNRIIIVN
ncbi:MAG: DUF3298 domain-containing protein [Bacteroidales bacterium]|nr:DUF3298 domain-containing protein [Bacteroidales bacterium]